MLSRRQFLGIGGAFIGGLWLPAHDAYAADDATLLFNQIRLQHGVGSVDNDPTLEMMALDQAKRMAQKGKVSHSIGWGNDFISRLRKFAIRGEAAENLCAGQKDVEAAYQAWMNSSGHRKNMLDPAFTRYGLAMSFMPQKPKYLYWAMVLAGPVPMQFY